MATDREILSQFLNAIAEEIKLALPSNTGETAQQIEVEVSETSGQITAPAWIGVLQDGRKPGTMPPVSKIEAYLRQKGQVWTDALGRALTFNQMAWATAMKMKREGNTLYRALHGGDVGYTPKRIEFDKIISVTRLNALVETFAGKYQSFVSSEVIKIG